MLADSIRDRNSANNFLSEFEARTRQLITKHILPRALEIDPTDTGCCVALWEQEVEPVLAWKLRCVVSVGEDLTPEQYLKYGHHAIRKGLAIIEHPGYGYLTSFERQNTWGASHWEHIYQGAVHMDLTPKIVSTSGFLSPLDEVADLLIGNDYGWASRQRIDRIIEITNNDLARKFREETGLI